MRTMLKRSAQKKSRSFPCLNCARHVAMGEQAKLYCSEACKEEAKAVRYARSCCRDGRIDQPDVREAIQIKLGMVVSGGYPERERQLSLPTRRAVIARDGGRCQKCGQPGTDVDHIKGSSKEMKNLQLLCRSCHNKKTLAGFVKIMPGEKGYAELKKKWRRLISRVTASKPKRFCDDDGHWDTLYPKILLKRQEALGAIR